MFNWNHTYNRISNDTSNYFRFPANFNWSFFFLSSFISIWNETIATNNFNNKSIKEHFDAANIKKEQLCFDYSGIAQAIYNAQKRLFFICRLFFWFAFRISSLSFLSFLCCFFFFHLKRIGCDAISWYTSVCS